MGAETHAEAVTNALPIIDMASQIDKMGVVGIFFIMLALAIGANYFLFKHAMANCGGMKDINDSLNSLAKAIEKANETQRTSLQVIKEFSDRETALLKESLQRETSTVKEFFGEKMDALYTDTQERLARIEHALYKSKEEFL